MTVLPRIRFQCNWATDSKRIRRRDLRMSSCINLKSLKTPAISVEAASQRIPNFGSYSPRHSKSMKNVFVERDWITGSISIGKTFRLGIRFGNDCLSKHPFNGTGILVALPSERSGIVILCPARFLCSAAKRAACREPFFSLATPTQFGYPPLLKCAALICPRPLPSFFTRQCVESRFAFHKQADNAFLSQPIPSV